jgi:hypothetical protein
MRISKLIETLEETKEFYGDLDVIVTDNKRVPDGPDNFAIEKCLGEIYDVAVISRRYDRYLEIKR